VTPAALFAALATVAATLATGELIAARQHRRGRSRDVAAGPPRAGAGAPRAGASPPCAGASTPRAIAAHLLAALARLGTVTGRGEPTRGRPGRDLAGRLQAGGVAMAPGDFALLRGGAAMAGLLLALPLAWAAPGRAGLVLLAGGPAAGHLAPAVWLARRTRRRAAIVERELADVLDLLRVAVAAGLSPLRAAGEVGRRHPGLLAGELGRIAARCALGLPTTGLLDELERRVPGEGVPALCAALRRADRHGAPLAPALTAQARDARSRAAARTAEAAARAAPRIQLVVALLLVPSVLALVAAALLPAMIGW
jgi:tight adherence protein C